MPHARPNCSSNTHTRGLRELQALESPNVSPIAGFNPETGRRKLPCRRISPGAKAPVLQGPWNAEERPPRIEANSIVALLATSSRRPQARSSRFRASVACILVSRGPRGRDASFARQAPNSRERIWARRRRNRGAYGPATLMKDGRRRCGHRGLANGDQARRQVENHKLQGLFLRCQRVARAARRNDV